jgi:type I restriction enzyme S subunit
MNKWKQIKFETLYLQPSRNGLTRPKSVRGNGFKMVNMGELFKYPRITNIDMERVNMSSKEIESYSLDIGDLLFARQSLVAEVAGKCAVVINIDETTTFESHLIRVRLNKSIANSLFYFYYFQSPIGQSKTQSLVNQVSAAGIRGSELSQLIIDFPPKNVQDKIVSVLSAYDELIENNNRRIAILEEMAQKLYREWFVHFRFPGHENCKMVESELGMIPEGWEIGYLSDIAYNYRKSINKNHRHNYQYYLPIDCIPKKSFALSEVREVDEAESSLIEFKKNDIVMGAMRVYFHKVICAPFDGITRSTCFVIRPRNAVFHAYLLMTIFQDSSIEYANTVSVGATMPYVVWDTFAQMKTVIPPTNIAQKYNEIVKPILRQINNIFYKNTNLRKTRDLLLPALINGDIDVSELDIKVKEE